MNAPDLVAFLPDVQSDTDKRGIAIDAVGVEGVRLPIAILTGGRVQRTVATFALTVGLDPSTKGTHMSRFIELLTDGPDVLDQPAFEALARTMLQKLGARSGAIEMRFPYFVTKAAPVSRSRSPLDHDVRWCGRVSDSMQYSLRMDVTVPATSLCPCSKAISAYGAHNQRSHIRIDAELAGEMAIGELIAVAEASASCEVYGLLKRADEKHVTERAYENPRFVEDLVREVACALDREPRVTGYVVEAENFESIHNHSAVARIVRLPRQSGFDAHGPQGVSK